jgi:PleD family two-component response regulator
MECVALDVERLHLRQNKIFDLAMAARLPLEILVAEDNLVNQNAAVAVLRQFGYQTDLVISGKEAVEAVERQNTTSFLWTSKCRTWKVSKLFASFAHA